MTPDPGATQLMIHDLFNSLKPYWGSVGVCAAMAGSVWKVLTSIHLYFTNHLRHMAEEIKVNADENADRIILAIVKNEITPRPQRELD